MICSLNRLNAWKSIFIICVVIWFICFLLCNIRLLCDLFAVLHDFDFSFVTNHSSNWWITRSFYLCKVTKAEKFYDSEKSWHWMNEFTSFLITNDHNKIIDCTGCTLMLRIYSFSSLTQVVRVQYWGRKWFILLSYII